MFDKLIVSEPVGADVRNRRSYFMVSSLVVGVLFATAVVISIYAADYGLGSRNFELSDLIAPADMAAVAPEPPKQQVKTTTQAHTQSQTPMRKVLIDRVESSTKIPSEISTTKNTSLERPPGPVIIGSIDTTPDPSNGIKREVGDPGDGTQTLGKVEPETRQEPVESTPPPVVKKDPPKTTVSGGVMNGKAINLPKPNYSAAAKAVGAQGQVTVQVLIDERGNVVSANASNGHPLLRPEAERAARGARFSVTTLSGSPVKVTGVIVYNFVR